MDPPRQQEIGSRFFGPAGAVLLIVHAALALAGSAGKSLTYDEHVYLTAGAAYWRGRGQWINPEQPPLPKLWAAFPTRFMSLKWDTSPRAEASGRAWLTIPLSKYHKGTGYLIKSINHEWAYSQKFLYEFNAPALPRIIWGARAMMTLLSMALGWVILAWGRELGGPAAGLGALALYVFCPSMWGHASLAATDLPFTLFAALSVRLASGTPADAAPGADQARGAVASRAWRFTALAASLTGLMLCKFSGLATAALLAAAAACPELLAGGDRLERIKSGFRRSGFVAAAAAAAFLAAIAADALVHGRPLYIKGLRLVSGAILFAPGAEPSYFFMGQTGPHFAGYFAAAFLLKMTLPALALGALGVVRSATRTRSEAEWLRRTGVPAVFGTLIFILISIQFPQIGVRYLFPLWPLWFIAGGLAFADLGLRPRPANKVGDLKAENGDIAKSRAGGISAATGLAFALLAAHAICGLRAHPHGIAYMNAATRLWGEEGKLHALGDSNLDWGQDIPSLAARAKQLGLERIPALLQGKAHPSYYGLETEELTVDRLTSAAPGTIIAISAFHMQGLDPELASALGAWRVKEKIHDTIYLFQRPGP